MDKASNIARVITEGRELVRALQGAVWQHQQLIEQRRKTSKQLATAATAAASSLQSNGPATSPRWSMPLRIPDISHTRTPTVFSVVALDEPPD